MKPAPFEYHRPESLEALTVLLGELDDKKLLAGGQSLMPMLNFRYLTPEHVIDINRVDALAGTVIEDGSVTVGAMTRQRTLKNDAGLLAQCPLIAAALEWVGHIATRNRGTVGGSLSHLDPSAELPAVMSVLDASLTVSSTRGAREIPMSAWALDYMLPDLEDDELLVSSSFELPAPGHGHGFHEIARRHGDFALAGAAALVELADDGSIARTRLALLGLDVQPLRLHEAESELTGMAPDDAAVALIREHAGAVEVQMEDTQASTAYRRKLAPVVASRALADAFATAHRRNPA